MARGEKMPESSGFDQIYDRAVQVGRLPEKLFQEARQGAVAALDLAEEVLEQAISEYGIDRPVDFPDTAYFLPVIHSLSGDEIKSLGDCMPLLNRERLLMRSEMTFANARRWGEATWYAAEIIEAVRYLKQTPEAPLHTPPWTGFIGDPVVRSCGVKMVDWTIPGEAIIFGRARDSRTIAGIIQKLMEAGLMIFLCDEVCNQLLSEGIKLGAEFMAYPLGSFTQLVHAANFALRAGMMFGRVPAGQKDAQRDYQRRRIRAFALYLGGHDPVKTAAAMGAINIGIPVVTDQVLPEDGQIPEWFISVPDYDKMLQACLELRGIKITAIGVDAPILVGHTFEGESIRRKEAQVEFGGGRTPGFELVRMVEEAGGFIDGQVELAGPDIDGVKQASALPLGIVVEVFGRKMQEDFEPVLERRIHYFINYGEGLWHVAQRDLIWVRISSDAYNKGFRLKHLGNILIARLKAEFPAIVDRVKVSIYTEEQKVLELRETARDYYKKRDERLRLLSDDTADTFFSCLLCQSFAPNHVCVISPERAGLCGAVSWLDARAAYEINPSGVNQPIRKEGLIDEKKGQWESFNDFVYKNSQHTITNVNLYTVMEYPHTSCGCFECILGIVPECNGLMVVNREHTGPTPTGMSFSTLAGLIGGGVQSPGFMGISKSYLFSRKFVSGDGGLARLVWMPLALKEQLRPALTEAALNAGLSEGFLDQIADETISTESMEILKFMDEKGHPALNMESLI
jgi:acetyl-CoA synthase